MAVLRQNGKLAYNKRAYYIGLMRFPIDNLPPGKKMAFLIQDVSRMLRHKLDAVAQRSGLTSAQWRVLASISRCASLNLEPLNQASLADMLDIEPITLSRQIDRLARAGLIERRPDPKDRRAYRLFLTSKAAPMVAAFRDVGSRMMGQAMEGVSAEEVAAVSATLEKIRNNLTGKTELTLPFIDPEPMKKSA
jgi:DNA-binding MarR family transcriptional regulator